MPLPSSSRVPTAAMRPPSIATAPSGIGGAPIGSTQSADRTVLMPGRLDDCVALARVDLRLLDGDRRLRGRKLGRLLRSLLLVVLRVLLLDAVRDRVLEAPDRAAHRASHLWKPLGTEDEHQHEDDQQELPRIEQLHAGKPSRSPGRAPLAPRSRPVTNCDRRTALRAG